MKKELEIGQRGYLAHLNAYVIFAEFVGYDPYEPDYPGENTRYYRVLERASCGNLYTAEINSIVDEYGSYDEVFADTYAEAEYAVRLNAEYWLKRKEKELDDLRKRATAGTER
jgi:hypothetical protein